MEISIILNNSKVYEKTIGYKEISALVMILLVISSGNAFKLIENVVRI